ncbi:MAG: FABP family protein [Chloroflexota bacterium]
MDVQPNQKDSTLRLMTLLEGTWKGEGKGFFPTIEDFDYGETTIFIRRDDGSLSYIQRTEKLQTDEKTYLPSHEESGVIRVLENGKLILSNTQSGGRTEILNGIVEDLRDMIEVVFTSQTLTNDERMVSSGRRWEVEQGIMRYEMEMKTTAVDKSVPHLRAELRKVG